MARARVFISKKGAIKTFVTVTDIHLTYAIFKTQE